MTRGAGVFLLGCTELPLILDETDEFPIADSRVAIVDPTAVLARKVAKLAMSENKKRGTR
jgi:aspartate racemase